MPIYEYKCECGHVQELYEHSHSAEWKICPKCLKKAKRIISKSGFNRMDLRCQRLFGHDLAGNWTSEKGVYNPDNYED